MLTEFHYKGFEPDDDIKTKANSLLDQITSWVPKGTFISAMLEKDDKAFRCSIDLCTRHGPICASVVDSHLEKTLVRIESKIKNLTRKNEKPFLILQTT